MLSRVPKVLEPNGALKNKSAMPAVNVPQSLVT